VIAVVDTDKAAIEVEIWKTGVVREILIHEGERVPVGTALARIDLLEESIEEHPGRESPVTEWLSPLQKVIGRAMETSKREIPHYYLSKRVCIDPVLKWINGKNKHLPIEERFLLIAPLIWAVVKACRDHPEFSGHFRNGDFVPSKGVHPALVIALRGGGSIAPAILGADALSIRDLMNRTRDLVERTRRGEGMKSSMKSSEFGEGTLTLTNLLDSGIGQVFGVIHPPQVALVGIGSPYREAQEVDGVTGFRTVVDISLSADHRVSDGRKGAAFLGAIDRALQGIGGVES